MVDGHSQATEVRMLPVLTLITRLDCGLCVAFESELAAWAEGFGRYQLETINVDSDAALSARYGLRVPVLLAGEQEVCAFRFRPERVARALGLV